VAFSSAFRWSVQPPPFALDFLLHPGQVFHPHQLIFERRLLEILGDRSKIDSFLAI
jgi:hypothetical protein